MKAVNASNVFGDKPIKRVEKEKRPKKSGDNLLDTTTDDNELIDIDEESLVAANPVKSPAANDADKRTPNKEAQSKHSARPNDENKVSNDKTPPSKKTADAKVKEEKVSPVRQEQHSEQSASASKVKKERVRDDDGPDEDAKPSKKVQRTPASSKKRAKDFDEPLDTSLYDPDQEQHEKRRAAAVLYKQFQSRAGPANPGSKEIPKGKPNCLAGLAFVLTGVFESMERDEAAAVIKDLGGRVTSAMSGKTNYLVAGEESGPAKIAKAEDANIPVISEDELLDLIREKSGQPPMQKKKPAAATEAKLSPKKEKASPVKTKRTESPVKAKRTASPVKSKRTESPAKPQTSAKQKSPVDQKPQPKPGEILYFISVVVPIVTVCSNNIIFFFASRCND